MRTKWPTDASANAGGAPSSQPGTVGPAWPALCDDMSIVPKFLRGRSLLISFVLVPVGWLMWAPWLARIKQPGGALDSDVYGGLLTLVLYLLLWSLGLSNLIYDGDHGYPSWKYSLASLVFAFALVGPTIMGLMAVLHLMGRIL